MRAPENRAVERSPRSDLAVRLIPMIASMIVLRRTTWIDALSARLGRRAVRHPRGRGWPHARHRRRSRDDSVWNRRRRTANTARRQALACGAANGHPRSDSVWLIRKYKPANGKLRLIGVYLSNGEKSDTDDQISCSFQIPFPYRRCLHGSGQYQNAIK